MAVENIERAEQYSRAKERLGLFATLIGLLFGGLFLVSGGARKLAQATLSPRGSTIMSRGKFSAALVVGGWLVQLPLSYINSYHTEHLFGLSRQAKRSWFGDQVKGQAIGLALALPVIEGVYWTIARFTRWWWLVISLAAIPLTTLLAQLFPVLIAPRFNKFEPLEDDDLAARIEMLAAKTGISIAGVMTMDMSRRTTKANAFFAGIGPTRRIVLADTLIERFDHDEIEVIVAHELAHQANHDIWRFIGIGSVFTLGTTFVANRIVRAVLQRSGNRLTGSADIANIRSLPVLGYAFSVASLVLTPFQLAYSRELERRADAYALALTRNQDAFSSAMLKLAESNLSDPSPSRWRVWMLYSHPTIAERIARAEATRPLGEHDPVIGPGEPA